MKNILITGSSGFYGVILFNYLTSIGYKVWGIDIVVTESLPLDRQIIGDLSDSLSTITTLSKLNIQFDCILHLATSIDFATKIQKSLYDNNVNCTKSVIEISNYFSIRKIIFTSSNSIYLGNKNFYIANDDIPIPADEYGRSKLYSENLLLNESNAIINIIRCPNIIDAGRVGTLALLFELVHSNSTLWIIGDGNIRHQCIYAQDLNSAILKLINTESSGVYNIGSNNVPTFKSMFADLIKKSGSKSRIRSIPAWICMPILKLLNKLNLSPFGPYQFRMLVNDFIFDISPFSVKFNWSPTKNNSEIIELAYKYYWENQELICKNSSANSSPMKFGVLSVLKYFKF